MHSTCLTIIHDPGMTPGQELNRGPLKLVDECSITELTLLFRCLQWSSTGNIIFPDGSVTLCGGLVTTLKCEF